MGSRVLGGALHRVRVEDGLVYTSAGLNCQGVGVFFKANKTGLWM